MRLKRQTYFIFLYIFYLLAHLEQFVVFFVVQKFGASKAVMSPSCFALRGFAGEMGLSGGRFGVTGWIAPVLTRLSRAFMWNKARKKDERTGIAMDMRKLPVEYCTDRSSHLTYPLGLS